MAGKRLIQRVFGLGDGSAKRRNRLQDSGNEPVNPFLRVSDGRAPATSDIEVTKPDGRVGAAIGRWGLRAFVWLVVIAGLWSLFVRPFLNSNDEAAPPAAVVDTAAAQATASRFTADYLTWSPASTNTARAAALQAQLVGGADAKQLGWSGTSYLAVDVTAPGQVLQLPNQSALVIVDARVQVATPNKGVKPIQPPNPATETAVASTAGVPAAETSPVPEGYTITRSMWVRLAVPVVSTGGRTAVAPVGPVFIGDEIPSVTTRSADLTADPSATSATTEWASGFMKAYAASDTEYQSSPGVTLDGLSSAFTATQVGAWSLGAADPNGVRVGTAAVTWKVAGADLSIAQSYSMSVTQNADRWYVSTIGPVDPTAAT